MYVCMYYLPISQQFDALGDAHVCTLCISYRVQLCGYSHHLTYPYRTLKNSYILTYVNTVSELRNILTTAFICKCYVTTYVPCF